MISSKLPASRNLMPRCAAILIMAAAIFACDAPSTKTTIDLTLRPQVQRVSPPEKILFVGNSFTYYNGGIDVHLRELVQAANPGSSILIDSLTAPDQTVEGHVRSSLTQAALRRAPWDVVVVQGASYEPVRHASLEKFSKYLLLLSDEIRAQDAEAVLFMTWAYRSKPEMIDALASAYLKAGNDNLAMVVPVGLAWEQIRQQRSTEILYSDDRHPSIRGTYLAACVFYSALFGESPVGNSYHAGLSAADARYLQEVAAQTTELFYGRSTLTLAPLAEGST